MGEWREKEGEAWREESGITCQSQTSKARCGIGDARINDYPGHPAWAFSLGFDISNEIIELTLANQARLLLLEKCFSQSCTVRSVGEGSSSLCFPGDGCFTH